MRLNRRYEQSEEFRGRQGRFDFAEVAHAVIDIALYVRQQGAAMLKKLFPVVRRVIQSPQMVFDFAGIAPASMGG